MKVTIILTFCFLISTISAVDVIDYETGECVSLSPCQRLESKHSPAISIVDDQNLLTEARVANSYDNTFQASIWGHGG